MASNLLRCTHVITGLGTGGAERMLQKLIAATDGITLRNEVVCMGSEGVVGEALLRAGVPVHTMGFRASVSIIGAIPRLRQTIQQSRPHVVQAWMYHANLLAGLATSRRDAVPVVWNIRASALERSEKLTTRLIARASALIARSSARLIVTNSFAARDDHIAMGYPGDLFQVIPNGFDLTRFRPDAEARAAFRRELRIPDNAVVIGIVGRNHPMKDYPTFLSAAGTIARSHRDVHFLLAGEGVDRADVVMSAAADQLGDRLHLLGPRSDIPQLMAALDVYVSASSYGEAFPNVLGEAMASTVPCVATDVGDSARVLGDTGFVVPAREPDELAAALIRLLDMDGDARRQLGERARERIATHFSLSSVASDYVQLYSSLVSSASPGERASS